MYQFLCLWRTALSTNSRFQLDKLGSSYVRGWIPLKQVLSIWSGPQARYYLLRASGRMDIRRHVLAPTKESLYGIVSLWLTRSLGSSSGLGC